jgi:hypothetical protein
LDGAIFQKYDALEDLVVIVQQRGVDEFVQIESIHFTT